MPLYEYECANCGNRFELIQKFSDPPQTACPRCGKTAERQLSAPAIQFKGTGWYVTDYARKSAPPEEKGESKTDGGAKDTGKSEKKSETKDASPSKDSAGSSKPSD